MNRRTYSRRAVATTAGVVATAAVMRNLIGAQDASPDASPAADESPVLLLRVATTGSMVAGADMIAVPEFSLFDDGSVYTLGPQLAVYPPPALPNLVFARISPEGVQALVAAARTAGLDEPRVLEASMTLADAPTTVITFFDSEEQIVSSAVGLMIITEQPADWDDETWESFLELRSIVSLLIGYNQTLDAAEIVESERSIDPERVQMFVFPASSDFAVASGIPNQEAPALVWPLSTPLSELAASSGETASQLPCHELSGRELSEVIESSRQGDMLSPWSDEGPADELVLYGVLLKPLLPDQSACVE